MSTASLCPWHRRIRRPATPARTYPAPSRARDPFDVRAASARSMRTPDPCRPRPMRTSLRGHRSWLALTSRHRARMSSRPSALDPHLLSPRSRPESSGDRRELRYSRQERLQARVSQLREALGLGRGGKEVHHLEPRVLVDPADLAKHARVFVLL